MPHLKAAPSLCRGVLAMGWYLNQHAASIQVDKSLVFVMQHAVPSPREGRTVRRLPANAS